MSGPIEQYLERVQNGAGTLTTKDKFFDVNVFFESYKGGRRSHFYRSYSIATDSASTAKSTALKVAKRSDPEMNVSVKDVRKIDGAAWKTQYSQAEIYDVNGNKVGTFGQIHGESGPSTDEVLQVR